MTQTMPAKAESVLDFWFGEISQGFCVEDRSQLWFGADPLVDRYIHQRFGERIDEAAGGLLGHWCKISRGRLALIVLLDQFPRNVHRGTPQAFAHDDRALEYCLQGMRMGHDDELTPVEQCFFYLPLEHSECLEYQDLCVSCFERMLDCDLAATRRVQLRQSLEYAIRHRDIVRQFGRFPHRNRILGRESTEDERHYLDQSGATFGQGTSDN